MTKRNENRKGYKKTKVGWIPTEWEVKPLGLLGSFLKGKGISNSEKTKNGFPCVTYGEIYTKHDFVIKDFKSFISAKTAETSQKIKKNDILFAGSGETLDEIGKCIANTKTVEAYAGGDIIIFRPRGINCMYLSFSLNSNLIARSRRKLGQGNSVVHIYSTGLKTLKVPIPPFSEQKAIADVLSTWDEAIEQTEKLIQKKKCLKAGQLHGLITAHKANSTVGVFAKPMIRKADKPTESYLALGIRSHFKGTFQRKVEDPKTVSMDTLYRVKKDDLILNITFAWEGAIAIVKEEDEACYVSHRFPTYKINNKKADTSFVRQLIQSNRMKYDLSNISPGGAGRNRVLNKNDFMKLGIWLPDMTVQKRIGDVLSALDQEINLLKQIAEKHKEQKRGLMQKLLIGEWRVSHMKKRQVDNGD